MLCEELHNLENHDFVYCECYKMYYYEDYKSKLM